MKLMIVPARSKSKRIPNKNIRLLGSEPLVVRTLKVSINCGLPTLFTTDSEDYIEIVKKYVGDDVDYELRPADMATDNTRVVEEISRICLDRNCSPSDTVGVMLPTSPFRSVSSLKSAINMNKQTGRGVFAAAKYGFPITFAFEHEVQSKDNRSWKPIFGSNSPMLSGNTRSQNQNVAYHPTGAIYIFNYSDFRDDKNFYKNADPLILQGKECIDIDDELDFDIASALLSEEER